MTRTYEVKLSLTPFSPWYYRSIPDAPIMATPLPGDALWIFKNLDGQTSYILDVNMDPSGGIVKYAWTPPEGADLDGVINWAIDSCIEFRKSYQKAAKKWSDPVLALSDALKNADRIRKNMKTET